MGLSGTGDENVRRLPTIEAQTLTETTPQQADRPVPVAWILASAEGQEEGHLRAPYQNPAGDGQSC